MAYGLFYLVLTDALFRFGGSGATTVMSLTNVVLALCRWSVWCSERCISTTRASSSR